MNLLTVKKALVLAAHPDDETLGIGGTIHKLSTAGVEISLLTFTDGESARGTCKDRNEKLPDIAQILGIKQYDCLYMPDNAMDGLPLLQVCQNIEHSFVGDDLSSFDIVFTHHPACLNVDHRVVYQASLTVFRPYYHTNLLSYYVPSSSDYSLTITHPNFFVPISHDDLQAKMAAAQVYDSEIREPPHSRSYDNLVYRAKMNGSIVGVEFAEGFRFERGMV